VVEIAGEKIDKMLRKYLNYLFKNMNFFQAYEKVIPFGCFHIGLIVGPWYLEWTNKSFCLPRKISSEKAFLCFDIDPSEMNFENSCTYLSSIRVQKKNEPIIVASVGENLIDNYYGSLGEDKWIILEQVSVAALEIGNFELSKKCINLLKEKFSPSLRVNRLIGMYHEAKGDFEKATKIYDQLLKNENTDTATMKRKIALSIESGYKEAAIKGLVEYLSVFMADTEAWSELGDLYLSEQMYKQALFCYEELILAEPQNYHYYTKCAEIKYTLGGIENIKDAINYYSLSLDISTVNNVRSLFGICLCITLMKTFNKVPNQELTKSLDAAKKNYSIYTKVNQMKLIIN